MEPTTTTLKRRARRPVPLRAIRSSAIGFVLLASATGAPAENLLDWQPIGRAAGVEAYSAQTINGTVRILFRNTNGYPVSVQVARTLIWCGSSEKGGGAAVEADLGAFQLGPAQSRSSPGWNATCPKARYFVEFRGMSIESQE